MGSNSSKTRTPQQQSRIWALDPRWVMLIAVGDDITYEIRGNDLNKIGKRDGEQTYYLRLDSGFLINANENEVIPDLDLPQLSALLNGIGSKLQDLSSRLRTFSDTRQNTQIPYSDCEFSDDELA